MIDVAVEEATVVVDLGKYNVSLPLFIIFFYRSPRRDRDRHRGGDHRRDRSGGVSEHRRDRDRYRDNSSSYYRNGSSDRY